MLKYANIKKRISSSEKIETFRVPVERTFYDALSENQTVNVHFGSSSTFQVGKSANQNPTESHGASLVCLI